MLDVVRLFRNFLQNIRKTITQAMMPKFTKKLQFMYLTLEEESDSIIIDG